MKKIKQRLESLNLGEDRLLSRKELKQITGGSGGPGDPCSVDNECNAGLMCFDGVCSAGECIYCTLSIPNGISLLGCWYRLDTSDPATTCRTIYPAYGVDVSGYSGPCNATCIMN